MGGQRWRLGAAVQRPLPGPGAYTPTTTPLPTTTSPQLDSCSDGGLAAPSWPKSGPVTVVSAAEAPAAAQRFVSTELGITGVTAIGGLKVTTSGCSVPVRTATTVGNVDFAASGTGLYVSSFNLGNSSGLGLMVHGRHVQAVYDSQCTTCVRWDLSVRYGTVVAFATARSSIVSVDLRGDPNVSGGYVYSDWAADGSLRNAHANVIPPGDFAAS